MATVNIPSTVDDPNYRYKMPAVRCKVEGSGNGIKTNHMNMKEVATALKRNPELVTKFLACELCVHGRYFENEGKAIFQGVHTMDAIGSKLDAFIGSYVLCPQCHLPEIDLYIEGKVVMGKCNACGQSSKVNNAHRVAAFILKNPPGGSTVGGKPTKEDKRAAKTAALKENTSKAVDKGDDKKVKKKIVKKKVIKKKKKKDISQDAFDLFSDQANTVMIRMSEKSKEDGITPSTFFQEMRAIQLTQGFSTSDRIFLALGALFDCGQTLGDEESFPGSYCRKLVEDFAHVLPYMQASAYDCPKDAISALQLFMTHCVTEESYKAHFPLVMKGFYDSNIVDDDDITEFYEDEKDDDEDFSKAKACLQPLINWLGSNDDDSDSYEEDSDGV